MLVKTHQAPSIVVSSEASLMDAVTHGHNSGHSNGSVTSPHLVSPLAAV